MANPQPTDAHIRIALEIEEELFKRKFTQLQTSALRFILRLSWACGKKRANIPKLKDFELCGIAGNKASKELEYLEKSKVIFWYRETNEFEFNKNYEQWQISMAKGFDQDRLDQLIHLNLSEKEPPQKVSDIPKQDETSQNGSLPKEDESSQKGASHPETGGSNLPKRDVEQSENPDSTRARGASIVSLYKRHKDHDDISSRLSVFKSIHHAYEQFFGRPPNETQLQMLYSYVDDGMEELVIYRAFEIARERGKPYPYAKRVIENAFDQKLLTLDHMLKAESEFQSSMQQVSVGSQSVQDFAETEKSAHEQELERRLAASYGHGA